MTTALLAFNRGLVSRLGLARVDVKRLSMAAEECWNFLPRVLGSMSIRPGWKYLGATKGNAATKLIPFVFAVNDTAIIEVTNGFLRIWRNDELVTRGTVGTGITNGTFGTDLTGWTDSDEAGGASTWATGGYMQLLGDGTNAAIREQEVTVSGGDAGDEHALTVTIAKGPVSIRIGSSSGGEQYVRELSLGTGTHSLVFSPTGNFFVRLFSRLSRPVTVDSVAVESSGVFSLPAPWDADDLDNLRWDQSGDIVFVACADKQPRMIKRWAATSWGIETFEPLDGPFRIENVTTTTLTASAITGSITLTASTAAFKSTHVGALFSITSSGQVVTSNISAQNTFTDAIRITGVDSSRVFTIILSGTWAGTVTLQRSLDSEDGPWEDITAITWTGNTTETYDDGLDNQIAWYRIGVKTGQYTSGTVVATLDYALGSITGVARVTAYSSSTSVSADVLIDLGGTDATEVWAEGEWSDYRGWPTAVAFHEGRLWWAGKSKVWGSVTDVFDSYDPDYEGDAGPISRSLGAGPVDNINWLISSQRLLIGADLNEYAARSSSLDEPLTPTQFNVKATSGQGSAAVQPDKIDSAGIFVNRTGMKVFEDSFQGGSLEYALRDLCQLVPEIGDPGIVRMAIQRNPDTRVHCVRSDGTVAILVFDQAEEVLCWVEIDTDGEVEDAIVLPAQNGVTDDYVYYIVKRTIDGATVRYLEKWAQAMDTVGGLGLGGDTSPFNAFSGYEVVQTDATSTNYLNFEYNSADENFYVAGTTNNDIYVHPDDPWTSTPTTIDGTDTIPAPPGNACLSVGGRYYWLSGDNSNFGAGTDSSVRVYDRTTGILTDMGVAYAGGANRVVAATDSPFRVWIASSATIEMYAPNIGTASLGSASWSVNNGGQFDFNGGNSYPFVWDGNSHFWWCGGSRLLQMVSTTGSYVLHTFPAAVTIAHPSSAGGRRPTYDSANQRMYVSFGGPAATETGEIYYYSGWNTTPTQDSGTWTLVKALSAPGTFYGLYMYYDATDEVLFTIQRIDPIGGDHEVCRYVGDPPVLMDTVTVSDVTPTDDVYPYNAGVGGGFYLSGHGYIHGASGSSDHLIKLYYAGPEVLVDSEGNSLLSTGTTGRLNNLADSYINYTGAATATVAGLSHLEGEEVVVWASGVDLGTTSSYGQTYTVASGSITLPAAYTNITVGLPYYARWTSSKLALQTQTEVLFGKERRITGLALILADTHAKGLRFGPDYDNLDDRPERDGWVDVDADNIDTDYDSDMIQFPATWATDLRLALKAQAPRPCTVLAVKLEIEV